ncbi:MAG: DUF615 domain-containing protein [Xanthomonadaceae bacterium]|nr:DUF615 domain-containing protein [Xanthomonadaceae bacterium]
MRGHDPETGEYLSPSRSQQRREALEVLDMAERLTALTAAQLAKLPVPESLVPHIEETRRMASHGARKRQMAFLAKQMRREEEETLEAIRDALSAGGEATRREVALMHRAETWRERLLNEGDAALTGLLELYPDADRQSLRQLIRNVDAERARNKPPAAFRELFRTLRQLLEDNIASRDSGNADEA